VEEKAHGTWLNIVYHVLPVLVNEHGEPRVGVYALGAILIAAILSVGGYIALRHRRRVPSGAQTYFEIVYDFIDGLTHEMIGEEGWRYTPLIASLFLYILCLNLFGLVPGFISPTASLGTTLALAITAFITVQFYGFRKHGIRYLEHFIGLPIREHWWFVFLAPLMVFIHLIGELAKPLSLSLRLFGNVFGEDTVIAQLIALGGLILGAVYLPLPVQLPMVLLGMFFGAVQAFIFSILTTSYIAQAVSHH
jgi:F-type H+-transporting ATPase subunit a